MCKGQQQQRHHDHDEDDHQEQHHHRCGKTRHSCKLLYCKHNLFLDCDSQVDALQSPQRRSVRVHLYAAAHAADTPPSMRSTATTATTAPEARGRRRAVHPPFRRAHDVHLSNVQASACIAGHAPSNGNASRVRNISVY